MTKIPRLSEQKLRNLLKNSENARLEFKTECRLVKPKQKKEFSKDICAMANYVYKNGGKGIIIIGYNKKEDIIVGIDPKNYSEPTIQQILSTNIDPPPTFDLEFHQIDEGHILVINISKNYSGPHQVINLGFPNRIGSTTGLMSTNEIYQTMLKRQDYSVKRHSEYDIYTRDNKIKKIINDTVEVLNELNFSSQVINNYLGGYGDINYHPPCTFIISNKEINNKILNFIFTISETGQRKDLFRIYYSTEGFLNQMNFDHPININLFCSRVGSAFFNNLRGTSKSIIKIPIKPNIIYFGFGKGFKKTRITSYTRVLPKFYISNVKSINDIKMKVEVILNWIQENFELLDNIFTYANKKHINIMRAFPVSNEHSV